jgi:flagellar basal body-associated protein FliL
MGKKIIIIHIVAIVFIILIVGGGFYLGYYMGNKKGFLAGKEQGFKDGQKAAQEIRDASNPYTDLENVANPFQQEYENPF